jgi:hypothetical protein
MVIKEARPDPTQWRDPIHWRKTEDHRDMLPREIRVHQKIDQKRAAVAGLDHDNLIDHISHRVMMSDRRYRIYLQYYEGGDLFGALVDHFDRRVPPSPAFASDKIWRGPLDGQTGWAPDENGRPPGLIPEGLIWRVVRSLITACQALHFGRAGDVSSAVPGWQTITYLDISLSNIFLQPSAVDQDVSQSTNSLPAFSSLTHIAPNNCFVRFWFLNISARSSCRLARCSEYTSSPK